MQREIKFRAWRKSQKQMHGWHTLANYLDRVNPDIREVFAGEDDGDLVLMQYTGLKDKNGVEWHEGDILGLHDPEDDDSRCHIVFENGAFCKRFANGSEGPFTSSIKIPFDLDFWQVIGNIYENPELLNK